MKFPEAMSAKKTMLIGIDVCHAGPTSVVGFSASTNREMTQYYSHYLVQKRGQEIVDSQLKESLKLAVEAFQEKHNGDLPTNYVIFRDGVGDAQRDAVIRIEVSQFKEAISQLYPEDSVAASKPEVTLVVVNKRINQRFFMEDSNGRLNNPPSGCIIDRGLVEVGSDPDSENKSFDFFITPASANQGCVLATHCFVPLNESSLTKLEI